jgi:CRISPR-associated protein Cas2
MTFSAYKGMWLVAMFDLPVDTASRRRAYTRFRKDLLREGFMRLQYSVYARYCISEEVSSGHRQRIKGALPEEGEVRVVTLTDHQFGKMEVYLGKNREPTEEKPLQLQFF